MKAQSEAHKGILYMIHNIVVNNEKEQINGKFRKKASLHSTTYKSTEPYFPWQQAAERVIREIMRFSMRKQSWKLIFDVISHTEIWNLPDKYWRLS